MPIQDRMPSDSSLEQVRKLLIGEQLKGAEQKLAALRVQVEKKVSVIQAETKALSNQLNKEFEDQSQEFNRVLTTNEKNQQQQYKAIQSKMADLRAAYRTELEMRLADIDKKFQGINAAIRQHTETLRGEIKAETKALRNEIAELSRRQDEALSRMQSENVSPKRFAQILTSLAEQLTRDGAAAQTRGDKTVNPDRFKSL